MSKENDTLIVFDVETTGTHIDRDQIIELSAQHGLGPERLVDNGGMTQLRIKP